MTETATMWIVFLALFGAMLAADLRVNRKSHQVSHHEALLWSVLWVGLALLFNVGIYLALGRDKALEFLSGYLIEKSLSVDNLFVFLLIFGYFGIKGEYQSRILKWGILGAIVMRAVFIFVGIELVERFQWLFYIFGGLLVVTAVKMALGGEGKVDPEKNLLVRAVRKVVPVTHRIHGDWFLTRRRGMVVASPLLVALVMVEWSDVIFAIDSIPAIFAVTLDPFIVFTSNIFAIMGLRALYFLLADMAGRFGHLKYGISFILFFIGVKMIVAVLGFHIPIVISLTVICAALIAGVAASLVFGETAAKGRTNAGSSK